MNKPCHHCDGGCSIYSERPQTCKEFECAYLQAKDIPESLRPDKCGILFIKRTDKIFSGLLVKDAEVTLNAYQQIGAFVNQGYSVVLIKEGESPHIVSLSESPDTIYREYRESLNGNLLN